MRIKAGEWLRMPPDLRMIHLRRAVLQSKKMWKPKEEKKETINKNGRQSNSGPHQNA